MSVNPIKPKQFYKPKEVLSLIFNVPEDGSVSDDDTVDQDGWVSDTETDSEASSDDSDSDTDDSHRHSHTVTDTGPTTGISRVTPPDTISVLSLNTHSGSSYDIPHPQFMPRRNYQTGPTTDLSPNSSPIHFWTLLFTGAFIAEIVFQTNLYASQHSVSGWYDTCGDEIKTFFGLLYALGIHRLPGLDSIWSSDWVIGVPELAKYMSKNRFLTLWGNLHLIDNEKYLSEHPRGTASYDKVFKLRPLLTSLSDSFKANFTPGQNLSVDEAMIKGKGRNPIKQYLPMKPIKRGSKVWCIADSQTGYLIDFELYTGKKDSGTECGLGERVVLDLVGNFKNNNHVVYCDNFFGSMALAKKLASQGTFLAATTRSTRKDFPPQLKKPDLLK